MVQFLDFETSQNAIETNITGTDDIRFTNSGVEFSWGVENGDGDNNVRIIFSSSPTSSSFRSTLYGNINGGANETFVLRPEGPGTGQSRIFGDTANPITLRMYVGDDDWQVRFVGSASETRTVLGNNNHVTLTGITGSFTEIRFINSSVNGLTNSLIVSRLDATVNCFCAGTLIETANGPVAVEDLCAGDVLRCADGGDTTLHWLGRRPVDGALNDPSRVNPICITAGALGHGLPARDLRVSPDHAIEIDGILINALALINGTTIYQERGALPDGFTYYHVETDAHDLILAEGAAAESFVDYTSRGGFENGDQATGRVIPEMPLPRISSARMVPDHVRLRLLPDMAAE